MAQNNEIVNKLRSSQLRPTKQRIRIAEFLFKREKTFHFTVEKLNKIMNKKDAEKISLATIYNTIDAFKKAGHLKEILTKYNAFDKLFVLSLSLAACSLAFDSNECCISASV